jgi:hypothetical protein
VCQFQRLLFKYWPQLRDLALSNCAAACAPEGLKRALAGLQDEELQQLVCRQLRLTGEDDPWAQVRGAAAVPGYDGLIAGHTYRGWGVFLQWSR